MCDSFYYVIIILPFGGVIDLTTKYAGGPSFVSDGVDYSYFCKFDELKNVVAHLEGASFPSIEGSCYCPPDLAVGRDFSPNKSKDKGSI